MRLDGDFSGQESGDSDRCGGLAGELCPAVEEPHSLVDLALPDEDVLDTPVPADPDRALAREGRAQPVGHRLRLDAHRFAGLEAAAQRIGELWLDGDDSAPLRAER